MTFLCRKLNYNDAHNILRLFDILPNFSATTSKMKRIITKKRDIYELSHELQDELRLRILGN